MVQGTEEAWVYRTADSAGPETFASDADPGYLAAIFSLYVDNNDADCPEGPSDEFAYRQRQPDATLCSGVDATLNTWFHVAASRGFGDTVRLFVNGILGPSSDIAIPAVSSGILTFGRAGDFPGLPWLHRRSSNRQHTTVRRLLHPADGAAHGRAGHRRPVAHG
jgi:hypothetical protein